MAQALDRHAEEAYAELGAERKQYVCQKIFKTLTDKGTDPRGIRRPTQLGTLCALAEASEEEVIEVIDVFRTPSRSFLMPPVPEELDAETIIDISHESLMRVWERLKHWTDEEAGAARTYRRLAEAAALYQAGRAGLWRDPELQLALDWREETHPTATWAALYGGSLEATMGFLEESLAQRDQEVREQEERQQRELEQAKALAAAQTKAARRMLFGALIAAVFAIVALVLYFNAQTALKAAEQSDLAARQSALAEKAARETADDSASAAQEQRQLAIDFASEAESAKAVAEDSTRAAQEQRQAAVKSAEDARLARVEAQNKQVEATQARREGLGLALANDAVSEQVGGDATLGALLAREAFVFHQKSEGAYLNDVYNALRQTLNARSPGLGGPATLSDPDGVRAVAYSPDGRWIASAGNDGVVYVRSGASQEVSKALAGHQGIVRHLAFSPDSRRIVSGGDDRTVRIWDANTGQPVGQPLQGHTQMVTSVAFGPGARVASASKDGTVRLWDANTGQPVGQPLAHDAAVRAVALSPNGSRLASGGDDGLVHFWDANTGRPVGSPRSGHTGGVTTVAFSPNGSLLASGSADGTVRLWNAANGAPLDVLRGHNGTVTTVAFSRDGRLASGSGDQSVRLWTLNPLSRKPIILQEHTNWVHALAFSPDGETLVTGGADRTVLVWKINPERLARDVCTVVQRALSEEEWRRFVGTDIPYTEEYEPCPGQ